MADAKDAKIFQSQLHFSSTREIRRVLEKTATLLRINEDVSVRTAVVPTSVPEASTSGQNIPSDSDQAQPFGGVKALTSQLESIQCLARGSDGDAVSYQLLKQCCLFVRSRSHDPAQHPWVHLLIKQSRMILPQPPARKRSPELEARLEQLQEQLEWKEYNTLVKDVDPTAGRDNQPLLMASFKHQAAFGLNVVTLMATGYIVGQAAMAALYSKEKYLHPVGGVIGLIISMMVEVVLYVIIADRAEAKRERKMNLSKKKAAVRKDAVPSTTADKQTDLKPKANANRNGPRQRKKAGRI